MLATDWQHFFDIHCVISHFYDLKNLTDLQNQTGESVRFFFCLDVDFHGIGANIVGALLRTVTPFCSCSSIPIFMGFTSAGLPLGVTFSFLIASPMVDLGSLVLLISIFGVKIAAVYALPATFVLLGMIVLDMLPQDKMPIRTSKSSFQGSTEISRHYLAMKMAG